MKTTLLSAFLLQGFLHIVHAQTPDSNKQVVRGYFDEVINKQKAERITEFF